MHIRLDTFNTYEDALMNELQVEMDEDYPVHPVDSYIEEKLAIMQNSLRDLNLKVQDVWCTKFSRDRHMLKGCTY